MRAIAMPGNHRYPLIVEDLSSEDMKQVTAVLHIDLATDADRAARKVAGQISRLPQRLRRSLAFRLVPNSIAPAIPICEVHKGINPYVIGDILGLVVNEVTEHFKHMDKFPNLIPPEQTQVMANLKAIQGMWIYRSRYDTLPEGAWHLQENGCSACMLSRVAVDRNTLCDLRITILSRIRTKRRQRTPRLLSFVDECIAHHEGWVIDLCYYSGQRAYAFKEARKAAVKAYFVWERDSKYKYNKYVPPDNETDRVSNHTYQENPSARPVADSITQSEIDYDRRLDSILACYGPNIDADTARSVLENVHGMPAVPDPLRIRKVGRRHSNAVQNRELPQLVPSRSSSLNQPDHRASNTGGSREPPPHIPSRSRSLRQPGRRSSSIRQSRGLSTYEPPRNNPYWQQGYGALGASSSSQEKQSQRRQQRTTSTSFSREESPLLPPRDNSYWQLDYTPHVRSPPQAVYEPFRANHSFQQNRRHRQAQVPSSAREPSSRSRYAPARGNHHWEQVYNQPPASAPLTRNLGKGKERTNDVDELARQYRDLLTPAAEQYSSSEYSDGEWTDASAPEAASEATTTWSLVMGGKEKNGRFRR